MGINDPMFTGDVWRAIERETEGFLIFLEELDSVAAGHAGLRSLVAGLRQDVSAPAEQRDLLARRFAQKLVLAAQGALMLQHAPEARADAFIGSRTDAEGGRVYGTLPAPAMRQGIVERAWPV